MNIFGEIKNRISCTDAAMKLGLDPDKNGRCRCPFHDGQDRNLKLYDGDRGFYCFVCHEGGDVIKLYSRFYDCSPGEAANKIIDDFGLSLQHTALTDQETKKRKEIECLYTEVRRLFDCAARLYDHVMKRGETGNVKPCDDLYAGTEQLLKKINSINI